jgi:hypothetical protein
MEAAGGMAHLLVVEDTVRNLGVECTTHRLLVEDMGHRVEAVVMGHQLLVGTELKRILVLGSLLLRHALRHKALIPSTFLIITDAFLRSWGLKYVVSFRVWNLFCRVDKDGSGVVSAHELRTPFYLISMLDCPLKSRSFPRGRAP